MNLGAFPDARVTVEDQIAEGEMVVTRWRATGTHTGELMGIPPTERRSEISGITINRLSGSRIAEDWYQSDDFGMLQQLGVIPSPEEVSYESSEGASPT
jgi:predicted ester cyclase